MTWTMVRGCTIALWLVVCPGAARAQGPFRVSCLPDRTIASPGDVVAVNVWVATEATAVTRDVTVRWTVTAGRIDEPASSTRWLLESAGIDRRHTATASVVVNGTPAGSCSFDVWVAPKPSEDPRVRGE